MIDDPGPDRNPVPHEATDPQAPASGERGVAPESGDAEQRLLAALGDRRALAGEVGQRWLPRAAATADPGLRLIARLGQAPWLGVRAEGLAVPHYARQETDAWGETERFWWRRTSPALALLQRRRPLAGRGRLAPRADTESVRLDMPLASAAPVEPSSELEPSQPAGDPPGATSEPSVELEPNQDVAVSPMADLEPAVPGGVTPFVEEAQARTMPEAPAERGGLGGVVFAALNRLRGGRRPTSAPALEDASVAEPEGPLAATPLADPAGLETTAAAAPAPDLPAQAKLLTSPTTAAAISEATQPATATSGAAQPAAAASDAGRPAAAWASAAPEPTEPAEVLPNSPLGFIAPLAEHILTASHRAWASGSPDEAAGAQSPSRLFWWPGRPGAPRQLTPSTTAAQVDARAGSSSTPAAPGLLGSLLQIHSTAVEPLQRPLDLVHATRRTERWSRTAAADLERWRIQPPAITLPAAPDAGEHGFDNSGAWAFESSGDQMQSVVHAPPPNAARPEAAAGATPASTLSQPGLGSPRPSVGPRREASPSDASRGEASPSVALPDAASPSGALPDAASPSGGRRGDASPSGARPDPASSSDVPRVEASSSGTPPTWLASAPPARSQSPAAEARGAAPWWTPIPLVGTLLTGFTRGRPPTASTGSATASPITEAATPAAPALADAERGTAAATPAEEAGHVGGASQLAQPPNPGDPAQPNQGAPGQPTPDQPTPGQPDPPAAGPSAFAAELPPQAPTSAARPSDAPRAATAGSEYFHGQAPESEAVRADYIQSLARRGTRVDDPYPPLTPLAGPTSPPLDDRRPTGDLPRVRASTTPPRGSLAPTPAESGSSASPLSWLPERTAEHADSELAEVIRHLPPAMAAAAIAAGVLGDAAPLAPRDAERHDWAAEGAPDQPAAAADRSQTTSPWTPPAFDLPSSTRGTSVGPSLSTPVAPVWGAVEATHGPGPAWAMAVAGARASAQSVSVTSSTSTGASFASGAAAGGVSRAPIERAVDAPTSPQPAPTPQAAAGTAPAGPDLDRLTEEVFDRLRWRLSIERERFRE